MPTPDLTVYHMKGSRSLRVTWLLEELGLPYVVELIGFDPGNAGGDEYRKIHPLNKVPALIDGKTTMFESVAIMQFVMNKYGDGGLRPNINDSDYGSYFAVAPLWRVDVGPDNCHLDATAKLFPERTAK